MLHVVGPGRTVLLAHEIDEGETMTYAGPHQWNYREEDGRFLIWRPGLRVDVSRVLGAEARITAESFPEARYLSVALQKRHRPSPGRWRFLLRRLPS